MNRSLLATIFFLALCFSFAGNRMRAQDKTIISKAEKALDAGDFSSAATLLSDGIALFPDSAELYLLRSFCRMETGLHLEALEDANTAIRIAPKEADGYFARAQVRRYQGKLKEALKDLDNCLKNDPLDLEALLLRAEIRLEMGEVAEAAIDLDRAKKIAPKDPEVYCLRSEANWLLGQVKQALKEANKAVKLAPEDPLPYATRANALYYGGVPASALVDINNAIELAPEALSLYNTRAFIREVLGDSTGADEDINHLISADTNAYEAYLTRAWIYQNRNRLSLAEADLLRANRLRPSLVAVIEQLGFIYVMQKEWKKTVDILAPILKNDPSVAFSWANSGYAKFSLGDTQAGLREIYKAIKLDPGESRAYYYRALIRIAEKKKVKACEDLEKAEQLGFSQLYRENLRKIWNTNCK